MPTQLELQPPPMTKENGKKHLKLIRLETSFYALHGRDIQVNFLGWCSKFRVCHQRPLLPGRRKIHMSDDDNESKRRRLLTQREVIEYLGISKSNWHDGVRRGEYPQPVRIGTTTTRWFPQDIEDYLRRERGGPSVGKI